MKKRIICIDIGHARGTGARGNGLEEHEQSVLTGRALAAALEKRRLHAVIIDYPADDNRTDLNKTIAHINAANYTLVISLHMDAADNRAARGAHVCYLSEYGRAYAQKIADRLTPLLPGRAEATVRRRDLAILRQTRPTAVLIEVGFITSSEDAAIVIKQRKKIAEAIATAIEEQMIVH